MRLQLSCPAAAFLTLPLRSYDLQPNPADADCGGAIDAKAATHSMFQQGLAAIIAGPTWDEQPVFTWRLIAAVCCLLTLVDTVTLQRSDEAWRTLRRRSARRAGALPTFALCLAMLICRRSHVDQSDSFKFDWILV